MRKSVASFIHKTVALCAALALMSSMVPLAWADDGLAGTVAGTVAGNASAAEAAEGALGSEGPDAQAPQAETQSASAKAAEGSSAGGTTVSIAVYRSSFPINDWVLKSPDDKDSEHEPSWASRPADLPTSASPGQACTVPSGYTRDMEPSREGYIFAGWSLDPTSPKGSYLDALKVPDGAPETKGYTFYAIWTPEVYAVVFDLAKNPAMDGVDREGATETEASFDLNWPELAATERTITSLGNARYRVTGFTVKDSVHDADYDPDTGLIKLPEPKRTGYRFLGWAEPDGQKVSVDAKGGAYGLNLARLPQIDGTPVLTARWTAGFGVTAPLSITFGDYDKTGAPGNPWLGDKDQTAADDTTQSEADDTTKGEQEGYQALGQAFFENTGWHEAVKLVGLTSTRHPNAGEVLTTYDSSKASEAQVLGDGTEANPGERLLSLYPSATADKPSGIHFRLTDAVGEADLGDAFTMSPQGETGSKKEISYGLNLSTDPVDSSANHGLVLPTNDYERKQIATVSYTFATAKDDAHGSYRVLPAGNKDAFYVEVTSGFLEASGLSDTVMPGTYGLEAIKAAANDLASRVPVGTSVDAIAGQASTSIYYDLYRALLENGTAFKLKVGGQEHDMELLGICQDIRTGGAERAGLTFWFKDVYTVRVMNGTQSNSGGWGSMPLRQYLEGDFLRSLDAAMQQPDTGIVPVDKVQQRGNSNALDLAQGLTVWIPSAYEIYRYVEPGYNNTEANAYGSATPYVPFQYARLALHGAGNGNPYATKSYSGSARKYWLRSASYDHAKTFSTVDVGSNIHWSYTNNAQGVAPCFAL